MVDIKEKFNDITKLNYADQAKWYLNGFWNKGAQAESESVWKYTHKFIELDDKKKADGCELDEFQAHKFLESLGETLTVVALREKLRKIDLNQNGKMGLVEYLCFKYSVTVQQIVEAPQGDNADEVREAASKLQKVQEALIHVQTQIEQQKKMLEEQRKAAENLKKSEDELKAAVEDLNKQESAYHTLIATLEEKANNQTASTVSKSKAAAELAQVKGEDPLPLRKAKISQEAALRKVEKERKAADLAAANLEAQTVKLAEAEKEIEQRVQEALEYLEYIKKKGGTAEGALWWMDRELAEAQKYLPKKKQTR